MSTNGLKFLAEGHFPTNMHVGAPMLYVFDTTSKPTPKKVLAWGQKDLCPC
jgi:hypothetical protein